jgi:hypothetical protein
MGLVQLVREENRRSKPFHSHEKCGVGQRQGVGMGAPTARSEDDKPEARFSALRQAQGVLSMSKHGLRSRFSKRTSCASPLRTALELR